MDITEKLKQLFNVPENWDKHDYEIHRYSFDDLLEVVELVKESDSLPIVSLSLPSNSDIVDEASFRYTDGKRHYSFISGARWMRSLIACMNRKPQGSEA
jgi:hypothetical protein